MSCEDMFITEGASGMSCECRMGKEVITGGRSMRLA